MVTLTFHYVKYSICLFISVMNMNSFKMITVIKIGVIFNAHFTQRSLHFQTFHFIWIIWYDAYKVHKAHIVWNIWYDQYNIRSFLWSEQIWALISIETKRWVWPWTTLVMTGQCMNVEKFYFIVHSTNT